MRDFRTVLAAGADFITRIGWNALRLHAAAGQRIDVLALLPQADATADCLVYVKDMPTPLRLVIQRMRPEQARRGRPNGIVRTRRGRPASRAGRLIHVP